LRAVIDTSVDNLMPRSADAVVIGAGMVGAAIAAALAATGRRVVVVDRRGPLGGTTAAGEGNILVSDKLPGPELTLALRSVALWRELAAEVGVAAEAGGVGGASLEFEFEAKGGVVVAHDEAQLAALRELGRQQAAAGIEVRALDPGGLREAEPRIAPGLAGGAFYPQDSQVQPMKAALALLGRARRDGAQVTGGADVLALDRGPDGAVAGLVTSRGRVAAPVVVNAAGPWSGEVADRLGTSVPVRPRRGRILVTEPLPAAVIRHKVYEADYVGAVVSDSGALQCSAVVEGTASGTVLVGSSRDAAGFSAAPDPAALAEMARRAVRLFPFLAGVRAIRSYTGFRPASPDHLPVIGVDVEVPGLFHATGHEGAGIGLAPATAELITALVAGTATPVDPAPFAPARFPGSASTMEASASAH
jgi:glycine/D-amino acid oxidase-like deaminating enzyme